MNAMIKCLLNRVVLLATQTLWKGLLCLPGFAKRELERIKKEYPQVLSVNETIDRIIAGASISRFGDGEFRIFLLQKRRYQSRSPFLRQKYTQILSEYSLEADPAFLVGIPTLGLDHPLWNNSGYSFFTLFWLKHWHLLRRHIKAPRYANAFISRITVFQEVPLEKIRKIWDQRDVVFIVPSQGRFELDDRLFDNVRSAVFIDVPPKNASEEYDRLLSEALKHEREKLYIIVAGQTATALAFDLHKSGRQAVDLGHLVNCYHEFLGEAPAPQYTPMERELITQRF